jgi:DNA-binding transcriptional MerR regulator
MSGRRTRFGYTVKQLAELSGVSVRALHYYDQIGLLKPAHVRENGYRYYGRDELLRLQQILFHRELGLSLDQIRRTLDAENFDHAAALRGHRETLLREADRLRSLVRTIDKTLIEMEGGKTMTEKAIYHGFDPEARARHEAWAIERYGEAARFGIDTRNKVMESWTQADHERHQAETRAIIADFAAAFAEGVSVKDERAQAIVRRLHACASKAWTGPVPRGGLMNIAEIYDESPISKAALEQHAPGLSAYIAQAIRIFCVEEQPWPPASKAAA